MLKGNHDYWWNSLKKLNEYQEELNLKNIEFLHNNAYEAENKIIARNTRMALWKRRRGQKNYR